MKSQLKSGLIIIFAVILASCSSTKKLATPDPNKTLPAPADKALLYVLRPSSLGFAINFKVSVDDEFLGMTKGRNYIFTYLEPGKHTILSKAENKEELDLLFDAGEIYYVEQIPKMGAIKARNRLEILNKTEGIEKLGNCKLAKEFVVQ